MLRSILSSKQLPLHVARAALLASCVAYVAWMLGFNDIPAETPLNSWFWSPADVGGLEWGERTARQVQRGVALVLGLCALSLLWRPFPLALWVLALFQILWAFAVSQKQEGFPLDLVSWDDTPLALLVPWLERLFPFATEAARIALPLVAWRMVVELRVRPESRGWSRSAEAIARTGLALTFAAHGIEALSHYHSFVDMILISFRNVGITGVSETTAKTALTVIGLIDLVLAVLVLATRWRWVALYMACWGFMTAAARLPMKGWEYGLIDFAVRAAHFALPLVLLLWCIRTFPPPEPASPTPPTDL